MYGLNSHYVEILTNLGRLISLQRRDLPELLSRLLYTELITSHRRECTGKPAQMELCDSRNAIVYDRKVTGLDMCAFCPILMFFLRQMLGWISVAFRTAMKGNSIRFRPLQK
jgi:hypothetical protein